MDEEKAKKIANKIIEKKMDPLLALSNSIPEASKIVGAKFESGEFFLGHLVMAGDLMDEIGAILEKNIPKDQLDRIRWLKRGGTSRNNRP